MQFLCVQLRAQCVPILDFVERRQGNLKGNQRRIAHSSFWNAPLGGVRFELNCGSGERDRFDDLIALDASEAN